MKTNFPEQAMPLFEFKLNDAGELVKTTYTRYLIEMHTNCIKQRIRYMFKRHGFIVTKTNLQLDKYLSGYFYSFEDNPDKAANAITQHYKRQLSKANETAKICKAVLEKLKSNGYE